MRNFFWKVVAWVLCSSPKLRLRIIRRAFAHPMDVQLHGYMLRWWVVKRRAWLPFHVRLHHIQRGDASPHLHNHPGAFRTFILQGWYTELRGDGKFYNRHVGDTAFMPAGDFHTIAEVAETGCMTLVLAYGWAKSRGQWGFRMDDGSVINHEEYHGPR